MPTFADTFGQLGANGLQGNRLGNSENWLAIVGDSGVTGAASRSDIQPTISNLMGHMLDFISESRLVTPMPDAMTSVPYSKNEYRGAGNFLNVLLLNLGAKLALKLDTHENSFGYIVGRKLGIQPRDIVLVGQDGVMVSTIGAQFGRIFEMKTSTLPPLVLLSYTANDMCNVKIFTQPVAQTALEFKASLKKAWSEAKPFLKAHERGTRILVLAPFDVVNVITNPEILAQKTNVEGQGEISCGQLRHGETRWTAGSWLVMRMLNLMCPSVTGTHPGDTVELERMRDIELAFGEVWKAEIEELNSQYATTGLRWAYLDTVRNVHLTTGDVGNDCFHPSARGHAKIAELILQSDLLTH